MTIRILYLNEYLVRYVKDLGGARVLSVQLYFTSFTARVIE
jgi:hypothetical protein